MFVAVESCGKELTLAVSVGMIEVETILRKTYLTSGLPGGGAEPYYYNV